MIKTSVYLNNTDEARLNHIKETIKNDKDAPDLDGLSSLIAYCIKITYHKVLERGEQK